MTLHKVTSCEMTYHFVVGVGLDGHVPALDLSPKYWHHSNRDADLPLTVSQSTPNILDTMPARLPAFEIVFCTARIEAPV
jgi:hypothetical protein